MNSQGNDFILVESENFNLIKTSISNIIKAIPFKFDQFLLLKRASHKITCEIYNSDSSIALQCGNGLRAIMLYCNKKYQLENVDVRIGENTFSISYKSSHEIVVNMGKPSSLIIDDKKNIQKISTENLSELNLSFDASTRISYYLVNTSNNHCVIIDKCNDSLKEQVISHFDQNYKNMFNLGFMENYQDYMKNKKNYTPSCIKDYMNKIDSILNLSVYERGAGWTDSCGSGATAASFVIMNILPDKDLVKVQQKGGSLSISLDSKSDLLLSGPSTFEYDGELIVK